MVLSRRALLWLSCITLFIAAFALRVYGIQRGLPYLYDVDEPDFVGRSLHMLRAEHLNPHWWGHPGTPVFYMLEALYGVIYSVGHVMRIFPNPESFRALYLKDPTIFYLSARIVCALFGAVSVVFLYQIATAFLTRNAAFFAAFLLAVAPLHVDVSRLARTDIVATFFLICAYYFVVKAIGSSDSSRYYLFAGVLVGLATVTKYPCVLFIFTLLAAIFTAPTSIPHRLRCAAIAIGGTCAGAFGGSPLLIFSYPEVLRDVLYENRPTGGGLTGHGFLGNLIAYVFGSLPATFTWLGVVLMAVGIVFSLGVRKRELNVLAVFPIALIVFCSCLHLFRDGWLIPALPFLALLAGFGVESLVRFAIGRNQRATYRVSAGVVCTAIIVLLASVDATRGRALAGTDTRSLAAGWIVANVPKGSGILEELNGPQLPSRDYRFFRIDSKTGRVTAPPRENLQFALFRPDMLWGDGPIAEMRDVSDLTTSDVQYVVADEPTSIARLNGGSSGQAFGERVYGVDPARGVRAGPPIEIFLVPPSAVSTSETKRHR